MAKQNPTVTLIQVLENPAARKLVEMLEEYISDGADRFPFEIALCKKQILDLTGYVWR